MPPRASRRIEATGATGHVHARTRRGGIRWHPGRDRRRLRESGRPSPGGVRSVVSGVGFTGELIRSADLGYDAARLLWNAMIDKRPTLIARCRSTDDVVAALAMA